MLKQIKLFFFPLKTESLLENQDIYIDQGFFKKGLAGKYLLGLKFAKRKVGDLQRQIDKKIYDLTDNDLYRYLENRGGDYEKDEHFENLISNIEKKGFRSNSVIICKYKSNLIKDGQHRAIYLLWKYGPDYEVNVIHIRVKNDLLRFKLFPFLRR